MGGALGFEGGFRGSSSISELRTMAKTVRRLARSTTGITSTTSPADATTAEWCGQEDSGSNNAMTDHSDPETLVLLTRDDEGQAFDVESVGPIDSLKGCNARQAQRPLGSGWQGVVSAIREIGTWLEDHCRRLANGARFLSGVAAPLIAQPCACQLR